MVPRKDRTYSFWQVNAGPIIFFLIFLVTSMEWQVLLTGIVAWYLPWALTFYNRKKDREIAQR